MKLELGAGPDRQTPGYAHNDVNAFDGIDFVGNAWELQLPSGSLEEVIAISFVEHLTYDKVERLLTNVKRMLAPGAAFIFDVPDIVQWASYLANGSDVFDTTYCLKTIYGWQRWAGDEHVSGWTEPLLREYLTKAGFDDVTITTLPTEFVNRGIYRYRFTRPQDDAHFYITAR